MQKGFCGNTANIEAGAARSTALYDGSFHTKLPRSYCRNISAWSRPDNHNIVWFMHLLLLLSLCSNVPEGTPYPFLKFLLLPS
jgi:hypothetical protein